MNFSFNRKTALTNIVLLLFSLIICFILLEVIARILIAQQEATVPCIYQEDSMRGWALQSNLSMTANAPGGEYSNFIQTNSRGERSPEISVSGQQFLILGIGDSMTFGQGVDENQAYLRLLENGLREKGKDVAVLNAGVGGYNTKQEIDTLEYYPEDFSPDLIVLGFFTGNDVYGNLEDRFRYDIVNGCLKAKPVEGTGFKHFLRTNLKSYGFFAEKLRAVPVVSDLLMSIGLMSKKRPNVYMLSMQNPPSAEMQPAWDETERQLERAQAIAEKQGIKIIIMVIPSSFQVYDEIGKNALASYGIDKEGFEYNYPEKQLASFAEGKPNLVIVPLVEEFRKSDEKLFYEKDPHLTAAGQALAAQILEREVLKQSLS